MVRAISGNRHRFDATGSERHPSRNGVRSRIAHAVSQLGKAKALTRIVAIIPVAFAVSRGHQWGGNQDVRPCVRPIHGPRWPAFQTGIRIIFAADAAVSMVTLVEIPWFAPRGWHAVG